MLDVAPNLDILPQAALHPEAFAGDLQPLDALNAYERAGVTVDGKPSFTVDEAAAQIDRAGLSWSPALGQSTTVTYAFRADAYATEPNSVGGFSPFSAVQVAAAQLSLQAWSDVANITFQQVNPGGYSDNATILFSNYSTGATGAAAFTYLPGSRAASSLTGDVFINNTIDYNANPVSGEYGQQVLTHEIGHAIGLSHPSDYDAGDMGSTDITYAANASYYEDSRQYSIMSYFASSNTGASASIFAAAPQLDDIAAAQRMYGANYSTRAGDTVYGFGNTTGEPWYNLVDASSHIYAAIWDGGGNDTLNFGLFTQNQLIDLREGDFSNVGGDIGNVAIAVGAKIENAISGSGDDVLIGNALNNLLQGGGGADTLVASGGVDTLDGGAGYDTVQFAGLSGTYTYAFTHASGGVEGGDDTLIGVETLVFADGELTQDPSTIAAQVARLYTVLGHAPDAAGLESSEQVLFRGGSLTTVAQTILGSGEFAARLGADMSNAHFVTLLYETILHREPDAAGFATLTGALANGLSRADLLVNVAEGVESFGLSTSQFGAGLWQADDRVDGLIALYDAALGRLPDSGGQATFFAQLQAGTSLRTVAAEIAGTPEFAAHFAPSLTNQQYVDALYQMVLHRAADAGGEATFTHLLDAGASRADVLFDLAASAEHAARIFSHTDYGLLAG